MLYCFSFLGVLQADGDLFDLGSITVTKETKHLLNPYLIDSSKIKETAYSSWVEYLKVLPVDLQSRSLKGGIQSDFSLRGSTFQGVLMLIDGQRINDPQTAHHNADIPLTREDIERVEVLPGASSSLFGPDAIGGAVNFILKEPKERKIVIESRGGEHHGNYNLLSVSEKNGPWGARFSVETEESRGFSEDTDFNKVTTNLYSVGTFSYGTYSLDLGYQEKEYGAYDFYTPYSGYPSREWTKTYLLNTGFNLIGENFVVKPSFIWRRHFDKFMLDKTQQRSRYLNHHQTDMYTPSLYFQRIGLPIGDFGLGLEYGQERIKSTNLGRHNRGHKSIYMDHSAVFKEKLSLGSSLRFDRFDTFDEFYTGSFNFSYNMNQSNLICAGISHSARIPSFTELYYNDPVTVGKADLSAEKSITYEAGYRHAGDVSGYGITFFVREESGFIDWVKKSASQSKWQIENISDAHVFGIEASGSIRFNKFLDLGSSYTYIDKTINDQGLLYKYGPNYIKHLVNTALSFHTQRVKEDIRFSYKKKPGRDGWVIVDSLSSFKISPNTSVFINVSNLFNVEYQEIEGIPQAGRWTEAGFRLEW